MNSLLTTAEADRRLLLSDGAKSSTDSLAVLITGSSVTESPARENRGLNHLLELVLIYLRAREVVCRVAMFSKKIPTALYNKLKKGHKLKVTCSICMS